MGLIEYGAGAGDADKVLEAAIEAGADDVESDEDGHEIWTSVGRLARSRQALEGRARRGRGGQARLEAGHRSRGHGRRCRDADEADRRLEDDDDVQTVWGNYDVPDEELEKLG